MQALAQNEILQGERDYERAIDFVIAQARRELLIFDRDLAKGGYESAARHELLREFLAREIGNRITIALHDSAYFTTCCPRLHRLFAVYGHVMSVHEICDAAKAAQDCFVVADRMHYVRRFHIDHARFKYALSDDATAQALHVRFGEIMQSAKHMPVTQLGL